MGNFKIYNVSGDGSCYYRCIWRIAQQNPDVAEALYIEHTSPGDEDEGAEEVRTYVGLSLKHEKPSQDILRNLLALHKEVGDLILPQYPLLRHVDHDEPFKANLERIIGQIEDTKMMACELEHEIIHQRLSLVATDCFVDVYLIVLTQESTEKTDDMVDKWFSQLQVIVGKITNDRVAILINVDNIHYKYAKFMGKSVIPRLELLNYLHEDDD